MSDIMDLPAIKLSEQAIEQLAIIASIPEEKRVHFGIKLTGVIESAHHWYEWDVTSKPSRKRILSQLCRVEKTAMTLKELLDGLNDETSNVLGIYALHQEQFGMHRAGKVRDFLDRINSISTKNALIEAAEKEHVALPERLNDKPILKNTLAEIRAEIEREIHMRLYRERRHHIADLVSSGGARGSLLKVGFFKKIVGDIRVAAATREWPPSSPQGGAPSKGFDIPGNPNVSALDLFVFHLYRCAALHGGDLMANKNEGTGSLIDFLKAALCFLPDGLVPPELLTADYHGKVTGVSRLVGLKEVALPAGQKPPQK